MQEGMMSKEIYKYVHQSKQALKPLLVERKLVLLLHRTIWQYFVKFKVHVSYDPQILLLGIYLREVLTYMPKRHTQHC